MSTAPAPPYLREGVFTAALDRLEHFDLFDVEARVYAILFAGVKVAEVPVDVSRHLTRYGYASWADIEARCHDQALTQFAHRLAAMLNPSATPVITLPEPETPSWAERHPTWAAVLIFVWLVGSGLAITYGWPFS